MVAKRANPTSVRLSARAQARLDELVRRWQLSRAQVIDRLLDRYFEPTVTPRDPAPDGAVPPPAHVKARAEAAAARSRAKQMAADTQAMREQAEIDAEVKPCRHTPRYDRDGDLRCTTCGMLIGK